MLADRVRMRSKRGGDELFLYNYGEMYGGVVKNTNNGEVSYKSDHIEMIATDMYESGANASLTFDTPLTNLYSKVTIESELIRSFGDMGEETYFLNDAPDPPTFAPSNYLHKEHKEHSKNSITLNLPADANGKFFSIDLFVMLFYSESKNILKVYSVRLHN